MKRREGRAGEEEKLPTEFPQAGTPASLSVLHEIAGSGESGPGDNLLRRKARHVE
jgi:hypothetical protein